MTGEFVCHYVGALECYYNRCLSVIMWGLWNVAMASELVCHYVGALECYYNRCVCLSLYGGFGMSLWQVSWSVIIWGALECHYNR